MGLGLDDWDIDYYYHLFVHEIGRDPTNCGMLRPRPVEQRTFAALVL